MKNKVFVLLILLIPIFFSFNMVCAENFQDLSNEINDNDSINLDDDVILNQETSGEEEVYKSGIQINSKNITIEGNNHIISGKDSQGNQVRIFNIINSNVTLSNMVLSSASFNGVGGAVYLNNESILTLNNVTFRDNSALGLYGEGGALFSEGHFRISNCTFENNYASGAAGAFYGISKNNIDVTNFFIQGTTFKNNSAKWYGGAVLANYIIDFDSCTFENNTAFSGAALHYALAYKLVDGAHILCNACIFNNNFATEGGATSTSTFSKIVFNRCNFTTNRASRGAVLYKNAVATTTFDNCLFEYNSANIGALFYLDTYEGEPDNPLGFINVYNCIINSNIVSDKASILYGTSANIRLNNSTITNNLNNPIYTGKGYIILTNSNISNYGPNFITQFLSGTIIIENNTWGLYNSNYNNIIASTNSVILNELNTDGLDIDFTDSFISAFNNHDDDECCSVYVRLNGTNYVISQRRDGGVINYTIHINQYEGYVKEFKPKNEYYFLSKVYSNGWGFSTGGWDNSLFNEKVEAIASNMALNEMITMEELELILQTKQLYEVGHLLIVAPNGTWGNIITYQGRTYINMGELGDGGYIVSPNDPDYRQEGYLAHVDDPVLENINLSSRDKYGRERHSILAHYVILNDLVFADSIYVSNEDGKFINQSNAQYCDEYWFKEEFFHSTQIPLSIDSLNFGTYYVLNKTILSLNITRGYNSDYTYTLQLFYPNGDYLANEEVNVIVNGKSNVYVTNKEGKINILFTKLTDNQFIQLTNPVTGEVAQNSITVVPRLVGSNLVMDYFDGSVYTVNAYDESGKPVEAGQIITIKVNKQTYKVKTNSKGIVTLTIPNTLIPNTYTLTATYAGQTIPNTIKVKQIIKTKNMVIKKSAKKATLTATLKTSKSKAIKGKVVSFIFNGKTYKTKTNNKGIATVTLNKQVLNKLKVGKTYVLKVVYLKDTVKSKISVKR